MKHKKVIFTLLVAMMILLPTLCVTSVVKAAPTFPNLPGYPVIVTITRYTTEPSLGTVNLVPPPTAWYLDVAISGIGSSTPPYDVTNQVYTPSWCVDRDGHLFTDASAMLYSSLDTATISTHTELQEQQWNQINYILNHIPQGATTLDIQQAIWAFVDQKPSNEPPDPTPSAISQAMIADATNNGGSFIPVAGQMVAVIVDPLNEINHTGEAQQISIIVLQIPYGPGLTPGFWKHNVGVYLTAEGVLTGKDAVNGAYSDSGSPLATPANMATFLSQWTDAQLLIYYDYMSTQGGGAAGAALRQGTANIFNAAAGLSTTVIV